MIRQAKQVQLREYKGKRKVQSLKHFEFYALVLCFTFLVLSFAPSCFAQPNEDLEFTLDVSSNTIPTPKIFRPNIDLSGRGFHKDISYPQTVAEKDVLERWQKDIGFGDVYRMQYSLWEISQLSKDKDTEVKLISNYEEILKNITDAGGIIILDIFGTPAGLGQVLDKKSAVRDIKLFKELIKGNIRELSCNKKYNIWYEVWEAPDLDDFFLGRKQEYLNLYRAVAESVEELEAETKIHIPVGGPSVSWWFQNLDGNTVATPEKSLIYELIKFCSHYHLPLNFISWHGFSTDPGVEKEVSVYKKSGVNLIRDWLTYFNLDRNTPLIVDEWNYDRDVNVLSARAEKSFISASYIPSRLKNMYEAGINYQVYFCLEDFQNNKEGVVRNVGVFSFDSESIKYDGAAKATYLVFRMLSALGNDMYVDGLKDNFAGVIATKTSDGLSMLIYNYIDPDMGTNYISKNIAGLNPSERKILLNVIKSQKLEKFMQGSLDISALRVNSNIKTIFKKARELNEKAKQFQANERNIKIEVKNLNPPKNKPSDNSTAVLLDEVREGYVYKRYVLDSSCESNCEFRPVEEKDVNLEEPFLEKLALKPYSVQMIVFKKKPKEQQNESKTEPPAAPNAEVKAPQEALTTEKDKNIETNAGSK